VLLCQPSCAHSMPKKMSRGTAHADITSLQFNDDDDDA
jgi:hypothetical protein